MEISSKDSARLDELGTRAVGWGGGLSERTTERREEREGGFVGSAGGILSFNLRSNPPATARHARPLRRRRCALNIPRRRSSHPPQTFASSPWAPMSRRCAERPSALPGTPHLSSQVAEYIAECQRILEKSGLTYKVVFFLLSVFTHI